MTTKRKWLNAGSACLGAGAVLTLLGTMRLFMFLNRVGDYQSVSSGQLLRDLVLPHIVLLTGLGLVAAAFVLFTRRAIIRRREQQGEP